MTKHETLVTVFDQDQYGQDSKSDKKWIPDTLVGAIAWMQAHLDTVPEQYQADVDFDLSSRFEYDCSSAHIEISYHREATEGEIAERKEGRRQRVKNEKKRDMVQLAHLLNKYPDLKRG